MWYLSKKIERIEKDIDVLKVQRNDLLWETDKMKNDPQYIQRYAVETYGYARPGSEDNPICAGRFNRKPFKGSSPEKWAFGR